MKKIYNILLLVLAVGFASCTGVADDVFDKSSAQRAKESIIEGNSILSSAENGWVLTMKADPGEEIGFGAYNLFLKFDKESSTVAVSSELGTSNKVITSHYNLHQSQGIVLSFDEYNEYIHYFSDPVNPSGLGDVGEGLKGDIEFTILKISKEEVVLKGKKSEITLTMVPADKDVTWEEQLNTLAKVDENMAIYNNYNLIFEDTKDTILLSRSYRTLSYTDEEGNVVTVPFYTKKDGIVLFESLKVYGHTITGFANNAEGYVFDEYSDENVKLAPVILTPAESFLSNVWYFSMSKMSPALQADFTKCVEGSATEGENILYASLGYGYLAKLNGYVLDFKFSSGGYVSNVYYSIEAIDDETVAINKILTYDSNASYYIQNCNYTSFVLDIRDTFKITPDNPKAPSALTFVSESNPDIYFTISSSKISYPANK